VCGSLNPNVTVLHSARALREGGTEGSGYPAAHSLRAMLMQRASSRFNTCTPQPEKMRAFAALYSAMSA